MLDLYNVMTVAALEPAWTTPDRAPEGGQVRLLGNNFVFLPDASPLQAKLAIVLPQNWDRDSSQDYLAKVYGKGTVDANWDSYELDIELQVERISSAEIGS